MKVVFKIGGKVYASKTAALRMRTITVAREKLEVVAVETREYNTCPLGKMSNCDFCFEEAGYVFCSGETATASYFEAGCSIKGRR